LSLKARVSGRVGIATGVASFENVENDNGTGRVVDCDAVDAVHVGKEKKDPPSPSPDRVDSPSSSLTERIGVAGNKACKFKDVNNASKVVPLLSLLSLLSAANDEAY
jgi:hypothetical protein